MHARDCEPQRGHMEFTFDIRQYGKCGHVLFGVNGVQSSVMIIYMRNRVGLWCILVVGIDKEVRSSLGFRCESTADAAPPAQRSRRGAIAFRRRNAMER